MPRVVVDQLLLELQDADDSALEHLCLYVVVCSCVVIMLLAIA